MKTKFSGLFTLCIASTARLFSPSPGSANVPQRSPSGFATLSFLFAIIIAFGMSAILFAFSLTLVVTEVTQYVTFAAARAQVAASDSSTTQQQNALSKFTALVKSPVLAPLYTTGWFTVTAPDIRPGDFADGGQAKSFSNDYPSKDQSKQKAIWAGVRTKLTSHLLALNLPIVGSTTTEDGLSSNVATILIREPAQSECKTFMQNRFTWILGLSGFNAYASHSKEYSSTAAEDNGC